MESRITGSVATNFQLAVWSVTHPSEKLRPIEIGSLCKQQV